MNKAVLSCKSQARVGNPTEDDFIDMVNKGTLTNFPVTPVDIDNASHMFGPDFPGVKIKTVRCKPDTVEVEYVVQIPSDYHRFFCDFDFWFDVCERYAILGYPL